VSPVHLLKRNQPAAVVSSEQHAAQAPRSEVSALDWLLQQALASQPRSKAAIDASALIY
jgi:hypothetical protein